MRFLRRSLLLVLIPAILSACGGQGSTTSIPTTAQQAQPAANKPPATSFAQAQALAASSKTAAQAAPNVFEQARNASLSESDLDVYIDPSIQGADRKLAKELMSVMPANQRGDFVYFDETGRLMSNNPAQLKFVSIARTERAKSAPVVQVQGRSVVQPMDYSSPCSPPNPPEVTGGAYVRQVSKCGFTAGLAFLNVPCGYSSFASGDAGFLYYEIRGSQGSLSEGGFQYNRDDPNTGIQPHARMTSAGDYTLTMNNSGVHYGCGQDLAIEDGATYDGHYVYTQVGQLPSSLVPQSNFYNNTVFSLQNAAWIFHSAPSDISGPTTDAAGVHTPCGNCSISRVTSIGQNSQAFNYNLDGSYFGVDFIGGHNEINWMQVIFADLESNCTPGTSLCTWDYSPYPTTYYGGPQYFPDSTVSQSDLNPLSNYGPYESYDSINLTNNSSSFVQRKPAGSFSEPLPTPTPTPYNGPTPTPRPKPTPNPCIKNPHNCLDPVRTPTPAPSPTKKP